jgi:peptide/nickel transport system permease protein
MPRAAAVARMPRVLRRFLRHRLAAAGVVMILLLALASIFAPLLSPYDPERIQLAHRFASPLQQGHILGADQLGRDVLTRLMFAGRISLAVGVSAMAVTVVVGFAAGSFAAYVGGVVDSIIMRLTDMMLCFPSMFLLLFIAVFITPTLFSISLIIGLTSWMEMARIIHSQVLSVKQRDYVHAARLAGASRSRIILRQILPNTIAPLLVAATLNTANAILLESYISFLGFGVQPPAASWGNMLTNAQSDFQLDPWLAVFPGLAIMLAVLSFNYIGDGLRDALDVRLRV